MYSGRNFSLDFRDNFLWHNKQLSVILCMLSLVENLASYKVIGSSVDPESGPFHYGIKSKLRCTTTTTHLNVVARQSIWFLLQDVSFSWSKSWWMWQISAPKPSDSTLQWKKNLSYYFINLPAAWEEVKEKRTDHANTYNPGAFLGKCRSKELCKLHILCSPLHCWSLITRHSTKSRGGSF